MKTRATMLLLVLLVTSSLFAQGSVVPGRVHDQAVADQQAADADLRARLAEELVASKESPGREFPAAFRAALIQRLKKNSVEQLEEQQRLGIISVDNVGDTKADLTYTILSSPCRIIDTRVAGGALSGGAPGPTRAFKVAGSAAFDLQGGTVGGCGIPSGATAALINFVAVNPQGLGNVKGTAYPNAIPTTGSVLNYQGLTPALNIANAILFPICDPTTATCSADINLAANGAGTDVVADVLGYAKQFPKSQVVSFTNKSSVVGSFLSMPAYPACANAAQVTVNAPVAGKVHVVANLTLYISHTSGNTTEADAMIATAPTDCAAGTFGQGKIFWADASHPTGTLYPQLRAEETFVVPAGTTTFYLNGMYFTPAEPTLDFYDISMFATFEP